MSPAMVDGTIRAEADANAVLWWGAVLVIAAALVAPLLTTPLPPLLDYPNHLARMLVILRHDDPVLARMYAVDPAIVPNIAMDLLVPPLALVVPLEVAGRAFIAACLLLPLAGAAVLHRALFRRRSYWPLGIGLVAYNGLLFLGFLNFVAGLGLALLAAGVWARQVQAPPVWRATTASVFAVVLFFCHLTAVAFFGALIAAIDLAAFVGDTRARLGRVIALAVPFVAPGALFLAGSPLAGKLSELPADAPGGWWDALRQEGFHIKFLGLTLPWRTYDAPWNGFRDNLDLAAFLLVVAVALRALVRRRLRVAIGPAAIALLALALYPLVPSAFGTAVFVDWRLPLLAAFLGFAALAPTQPHDAIARVLAFAVAVVMLARIGLIAVVWAGHNRDLDDLARVIAPVEAGAKVLAVTTTPLPNPGGDPPSRGILYDIDATTHLPALLLLRQRAFWPNLFTSETLQIVHVRPPYRDLSATQAVLPTVAALDAPTGEDQLKRPFVRNWRANFDYVLVMRPAALGAPPEPGLLEPLTHADIAALYRVRR